MLRTLLFVSTLPSAGSILRAGSHDELIPDSAIDAVAGPAETSATVETPHPKEGHFESYMRNTGTDYKKGSEEYAMRFSLFLERHALVEKMNSRPGKSWTAALNAFGAHTDSELKRLFGYKRRRTADVMAFREMRTTGIGRSVHEEDAKDWSKELDSLSNIRDQGRCGSCWAVTSTTVLDAHAEIKGQNMTFSTQQVVDCVPNPSKCGGSGGCDGATVELAFQYAMLAGLQTPQMYGGYTGDEHSCAVSLADHSSPSMSDLTEFPAGELLQTAPKKAAGLKYGLVGWYRLPSNSFTQLFNELFQEGPVAVALTAGNLFWYSSGIFDGCEDDRTVNHAVTLVGAGSEKGQKYWLIQNSWGDSWGEAGRIRIQRESGDKESSNCGMDTEPEQGIACEGETDPVRVCGSCGILFDSVIPRFSH